MLPQLFNSTTIPVLEQVARFTEARHNVLAGNIANMDTPGYLARDLSPARFEERLKQAVSEQRLDASLPSLETTAGVLQAPAPDAATNPLADLSDTMHTLTYLDESDVDMERQVAALTKNQAQYNLALGIMNSQFRLLQAAISERV